VNVDSMRSAQLVNRKQFYVSMSRARHDARVYTDDAEALRRAVARTQDKELTLDVTQQQQPRQSTTMRI
jgi:ATP-dependent exoDNAse (exonuclease V) alpha subunit